jgi:hypothetical protein
VAREFAAHVSAKRAETHSVQLTRRCIRTAEENLPGGSLSNWRGFTAVEVTMRVHCEAIRTSTTIYQVVA